MYIFDTVAGAASWAAGICAYFSRDTGSRGELGLTPVDIGEIQNLQRGFDILPTIFEEQEIGRAHV